MLSVVESGSGEPLVLLHGWGLHGGVWKSILPHLNENFHCYAVDMLGHGESQSSLSFSLDNMNLALDNLVSSIESNNIALLGWSLGGLVAMQYLSQNSKQTKKINSLMLVCSNACFCQKEEWRYAIEPEVLDGFADQLEKDYKKTVDKFMALQMFGADDYKTSLKELKESVGSRLIPSLDALTEGLKVLKNTDLTGKLKLIQQKVLMINGEHDRLVPYQAGESMKSYFNNAQIKTIKGAGHAPFISHKKELIKVITEFNNESQHV